MTIALWSPRLATGIPVIDTQHQALFAAVNDLAEAFRAGRAGQQVRDSLAFLARYTQEHFQDEEQLMREMDYPDLERHRAEHMDLIAQLQGHQARLAAGKSVTMEVTIFFADWLQQHIHDSDLAYVTFLKAKQESE